MTKTRSGFPTTPVKTRKNRESDLNEFDLSNDSGSIFLSPNQAKNLRRTTSEYFKIRALERTTQEFFKGRPIDRTSSEFFNICEFDHDIITEKFPVLAKLSTVFGVEEEGDNFLWFDENPGSTH